MVKINGSLTLDKYTSAHPRLSPVLTFQEMRLQTSRLFVIDRFKQNHL